MLKPRVLFLCAGNSCRSQMAEGWLRHVAGDRFDAVSAGTDPAGLHPDAIRVMAEIGIDIAEHHSKHVAELLGQHIPFVVTVCDVARESCPVFPGTYCRLHWSFEDPARAAGSEQERLAVFRRVRDGIGERVKLFVAENGQFERVSA